jgi:hypothetical protein
VAACADTINEAGAWIGKQTVHTSTNTLAAIKAVLDDCAVTTAVLLSDGLPDCHPRHIYAAVRNGTSVRKLRIDTIAFNCDELSTEFLVRDLCHVACIFPCQPSLLFAMMGAMFRPCFPSCGIVAVDSGARNPERVHLY